MLRREIEKSNAVLVVIDPFVSYLGKQINSWNDQDVRRAMASLSQLAEQTGAAIVLIRHPNKKEDVKNRLYRGGGSIGIIAAARSALLVMPDPLNPNVRVLSTTKCNLAAPPKPLLFEVESVEYEGSDEGIPHILWRGQQSQPTVRSLSSTVRQKLSPIDDAKEFLRESLEKGAQKANQIFRDAKASEISFATLRRAKLQLHVESVRKGFGDKGEVFWKLPSTE